MNSSATIKIDLDKTLYVLFCCYAFSLPFELALEKLFNIVTIFKPFRILSIIIIGVFGIRTIAKGVNFDSSNRIDLFLYGVYFYGFFISLIRMIEVVFDMGLFFNDIFQVALFLSNFYIFKTIRLSKIQLLQVFKFFAAGIIGNSLYTFWTIFTKTSWGRSSGFFDNPNYFAIGIFAVIVFLALKFNYQLKFRTKIGAGFLLLFLFNMFGVAGSRGAFMSLIIALILIFVFFNLQKKIVLLFFATLISIFFFFNNLSSVIGNNSYTLIHRINQDLKAESESDNPRLVIWRGVFRALEERGYGGLGIGQFKANFVRYFGEESNNLVLEMVNRGYYLSPHNDYLYLLSDYGLPSLIFYLIFLALSVKRLSSALNKVIFDKKEHFLVRFKFIILIGLIIFGLTTDSLIHPVFWFLLMFSTYPIQENNPTRV